MWSVPISNPRGTNYSQFISKQSKLHCEEMLAETTPMGRLRRKRRGLPEEASAGPGSADLREAERGELSLIHISEPTSPD